MNRVLLDSDVILDFFFNRQPLSIHSEKVIALCEEKKIQGFVTSVIVSNVYYLLRKSAPHEDIVDKLSQLLSLIDVLVTDKKVLRLALFSEFKDFEDAIQHFSAQQSGTIDVIITRNIKDYKKSALAVMAPDDYLKVRGVIN